ncbi:uncharacterized protein LOC110984285 [Acanthaster planci]|uniref:Small vasohibin-binding protein n=1 Tax=Acanthaster planci TaxID=133434 RepID=A0A8B7Z5D3_ACAPL|nr:uncharacterized protein LOC110984285 [Acanthaster planci]XP_022100001.1 uncharacterized protein LOC110984285 [Acanthaster planci]XP_022100003.1 uncharacterized protein LOC110984285 [Acanthaster planci]
MSVRVCVYPVPISDPGSISRYGSASSSVVSGRGSPSRLISASATCIAAISQQAANTSASSTCRASAVQTEDGTVSPPTQSQTCSLPEIPNSPSLRSVATSDSPLLVQVRNIAERQKEEMLQGSAMQSTTRSSTFPNFRALQRLALSARTSTNSRRSSTTCVHADKDLNRRSTLSNSNSSRTPGSNSTNHPADERCGKSFQLSRGPEATRTPADFCALTSLPGNRQDERLRWKSSSSDEMMEAYVADHPMSSKFHKKKSAKKKKRKTKRTKSRSHLSQKHPPESKQSLADKKATVQDSLGTLLRAMPVVVETKKIEVYSSRYGKCETEGITPHRTERKSSDIEKANSPNPVTSLQRDSPQGAFVSNLTAQGRHPIIYASRVSPRIPGPGGLGNGSREQDNLSRVTRVYLSDKQSGNLRECGSILPCAPPCTPTPQMMQKYQYIPSMMDLRSQRAVRDRLSGMEQKAKKKQQQQREEARKVEQQLQRDQVSAWKQRQRLEIYALNKIMTEFEENNFQQFMKMMSGKTP